MNQFNNDARQLANKLNFLKEKHFNKYIETRKIVYDEISKSQTIFCCCGKLATGFHELSCTKFHKKIDKETIKKLSSLFISTT